MCIYTFYFQVLKKRRIRVDISVLHIDPTNLWDIERKHRISYFFLRFSPIMSNSRGSCIILHPKPLALSFFLWRFAQMPRQTLNIVKAPGREMGWCDPVIGGHGVKRFCLVMSHETPVHGLKILAHSPFTAYFTWVPCRLIALSLMAWEKLGTMLHLSGIGWKLGKGFWHVRIPVILPSPSVSKIKRYLFLSSTDHLLAS